MLDCHPGKPTLTESSPLGINQNCIVKISSHLLTQEHLLPTDFSRTFSSLLSFDTENNNKIFQRDALPSVRNPKQNKELGNSEKRMVSNIFAVVLISV